MSLNHRSLVLASCCLAIILAWYLFAFRTQIAFWQSHDDYVYLSLSHALSFEQRLNGEGFSTNGGLAGHPGVPFHLASWLAWKLAFPGATETFASVLGGDADKANRFGAAASIVALLITLAGVALVFAASKDRPWWVPVAATAVYFASTPETWIAATRLGIETFALAIAALFYITATRALKPDPGWLDLLVFGTVSGLAYTLKLHYIVFFVSGMAGIAALAVTGGFGSIAKAALGSVAYGVRFLAGFLPLSLLVAGSYALERLMKFHLSVVLHSGHYGEGEATIVAPRTMLRSISQLMDQPVAAFIAVVALGVILVVATRMARRLRPDGPLALWACLAIALLLSYLSVLKHFQFHYLVVPSAVVAIGVLSAFADTRRNERLLTGALAIAAGLACVLVTIPAFIRQNEVLQAMTRDVLDDARLIKQMSSGSDAPTVWDYRVPVQELSPPALSSPMPGARGLRPGTIKPNCATACSSSPGRFAGGSRSSKNGATETSRPCASNGSQAGPTTRSRC